MAAMSLKDHGVNVSIVPCDGGWKFEQPHLGGVQRIPVKGDAGSADRLIEQVKIFRARAHIDMGDPEADIAEYIKRVSPMNNRFPTRKQREAVRVKHRPIIERIRDQILVTSQRQVRFVFPEQAYARMNVCLNCPQNVKWMTGCVPCCDEIKSRGQNLRQKPADESDKLGACRLHDFYLPAFVWLDREELGEFNTQAPSECWMRTEAIANFDRIEDGDLVAFTNHGKGYTLDIKCPGCKLTHTLPIKGFQNPYGENKPEWTWNLSKQRPTLTPSLLCNHGLDGKERCHFTLTEGVLDFHTDSTHELSGTKQPLPPITS